MSDSPPDYRSRTFTWPIDLEPTSSTVVSNPSTRVGIQSTQNVQEPSSTTGGPRNVKRNRRGNITYVEILTRAISSSPRGQMTLSEIYTWMINNFDYFRERSSSSGDGSWKHSVRKSLSANKRFVNIKDETSGRSLGWLIVNDALHSTPPRPRRTNCTDNNTQNSPVKETENTIAESVPIPAFDGAFQSRPNTRRSFRSRVTPSHTFRPYQLNYPLQQQPNLHPDCQYQQQIYQENTRTVDVPLALPLPLENQQQEQVNWRPEQQQNVGSHYYPQENRHSQERLPQHNILAEELQQPFPVTNSNHRLQDIQYQQTYCQPMGVSAAVHQSSSPMQPAVMRQQPQDHQHRPRLHHYLEVPHKTNQQPPHGGQCQPNQQQHVQLEVRQESNPSEASTSMGPWMAIGQQTQDRRYNPPVNISEAVPQQQLRLEVPQIPNQQQPQISECQQCPPQQHLDLECTQESNPSELSTITSQGMNVSPESRQQLNRSPVSFPVETPPNLNPPESEPDLSALLKMCYH